jgi:hypothetical protein
MCAASFQRAYPKPKPVPIFRGGLFVFVIHVMVREKLLEDINESGFDRSG